MRVFKPAHLGPERFELLGAALPDSLERREIIDELARAEHGDHHVFGAEVRERFALPCVFRVEDRERLRIVRRLVIQAEIVRKRLAVRAVVEAVKLLEVGDRDLGDVFAHLDLRDDLARFTLHGDELVYAAEHRLALGSDEPLADAEGVDARALQQQVLDDIFVERVGAGDGAALPARLVEHAAGLLREIGHIAGVEPDAAFGDAHGLEHIVEGADGVGNAGFERVVGIYEQHRVRRVALAVGAEGVILGIEHLHPGVRHRAESGNAVELVGDRAGGAGAARDIRRARAEDRRVRPLRPAGAEFHHRAAPRGTDDAARLRCDERLVVHREQEIRLHELRLDRGGAHRNERLAREHRRAFRHGPDVAGEPEIAEILQKLLAENAPRAEIVDVLIGEVEIGDIFHDLLQPRGNGEAAAVRHLPEEEVEVGDAVLISVAEVAVAHRQLVKIAEHRKILGIANVHGKVSSCR